MSNNYDVKSIPLDIKALNTDGQFEGYASTFNNVDNYGDVIMSGAYAKTLSQRSSPVKLLWQHSQSNVIGKFVEIYEDDKGLYVKGQLNLDVQKGKEAYALLKEYCIDAMSIGYKVVREEYTDWPVEDDNGNTMSLQVRVIKEIKLYEVSLVTFPANELATVGAVKTEFEKLDEEGKHQVINKIKELQTEAPDTEARTSSAPTDDAAEGSSEIHPEENEVEGKLDEIIQHYKDFKTEKAVEKSINNFKIGKG